MTACHYRDNLWLMRVPGALKLRSWREKQTPRKSQTQLASDLGVRQSTVAEWEAGKRIPQGSHMVDIQKLTGIPVESWTLGASKPLPTDPGSVKGDAA